MLSNLIRMWCSLDHLGSPLTLWDSCLNEKCRKELKVLKKTHPKKPPTTNQASKNPTANTTLAPPMENNYKATHLLFLLSFQQRLTFYIRALIPPSRQIGQHHVRELSLCLFVGVGSALCRAR